MGDDNDEGTESEDDAIIRALCALVPAAEEEKCHAFGK
jgi:hypothetical protein